MNDTTTQAEQPENKAEDIKQTLRALSVAIGRIEGAVDYLSDELDGADVAAPGMKDIIVDGGKEAVSIIFEAMEKLPDLLGVDISNEGGCGSESSLSQAYLAFRAEYNKHMMEVQL